jgi:hypothetical protein
MLLQRQLYRFFEAQKSTLHQAFLERLLSRRFAHLSGRKIG